MSCCLALYIVSDHKDETTTTPPSLEQVTQAVDKIIATGIWTTRDDIIEITEETLTINRETDQPTDEVHAVVVVLAPSRTDTLLKSATYPLDTLITELYNHLYNVRIWVDGFDYNPDSK